MTAPAVPDLAEFLRARYTEDKHRVLSVGPAKLGWGTYLHPDGGMGYTSPVASVHGDDRDWYGCRARTEDPHTDYDMPSGNACTCGRDEEVEHALRLLALPFAGHPRLPAGVGR